MPVPDSLSFRLPPSATYIFSMAVVADFHASLFPAILASFFSYLCDRTNVEEKKRRKKKYCFVHENHIFGIVYRSAHKWKMSHSIQWL